MIPELVVHGCHDCPFSRENWRRRIYVPGRFCTLSGKNVSYKTVPEGCPIKFGPVQIRLVT